MAEKNDGGGTEWRTVGAPDGREDKTMEPERFILQMCIRAGIARFAQFGRLFISGTVESDDGNGQLERDVADGVVGVCVEVFGRITGSV